MSKKYTKKAKKPGQKKNAKNILLKRKGEFLILILAIMILLVSIFTLSYSWFEPGVRKGTGMTYHADVQVRSQNCTITGTYAATQNSVAVANRTGDLEYNTEPINTSSAIQVPANDIYYFRTTITNADPAPTNGSLYINSLPAPASGSTYGLGVAYPSSSYHKYSTAGSNVWIVRNAYIAGKKDGENGILHVDWFIKTGAQPVSIDLSGLYWNYN